EEKATKEIFEEKTEHGHRISRQGSSRSSRSKRSLSARDEQNRPVEIDFRMAPPKVTAKSRFYRRLGFTTSIAASFFMMMAAAYFYLDHIKSQNRGGGLSWELVEHEQHALSGILFANDSTYYLDFENTED